MSPGTRSQSSSQVSSDDVEEPCNVTLAASIADLQRQFDAFRTGAHDEYDAKLEIIKGEYESKIAHLEDKLNAVIKGKSESTLQCIKHWISALDDKIDKANVELDIVKNDNEKNKHGVINIKTLVDGVATLAEKNETEISIITEKYINPAENQFPSFTRFARSENVSRTMDNGPATNNFKTLESRIDSLEDQSRRDNLLFYGFKENKNEMCHELIRELITTKILKHNPDAKYIKFVRVHRLGKFDKK